MSLIKVVKAIGNKKDFGVEFKTEPDEFTVARLLDSQTNDVQGFVNMVKGSEKTMLDVDKAKTDIEPMFPISNEGLGIIISGEQGSGKSTLSAMFLIQYGNFYPKNRMFFVSQKSKMVDRNLSQLHQLYQMGNDLINNFNLEEYKDSIFLFDDSDFGNNTGKVMEMLNLISTVGREYNISWIFVTHFNSRLNKTKAYTEYKVYITFNDNLHNNRMLLVHMGLNKAQIAYLAEKQCSFYMFSKVFNILITDKFVYKLSKVRNIKPIEKSGKKSDDNDEPKKKREKSNREVSIDLEAFKKGVLRKATNDSYKGKTKADWK